jgi:hypothetical protein
MLAFTLLDGLGRSISPIATSTSIAPLLFQTDVSPTEMPTIAPPREPVATEPTVTITPEPTMTVLPEPTTAPIETGQEGAFTEPAPVPTFPIRLLQTETAPLIEPGYVAPEPAAPLPELLPPPPSREVPQSREPQQEPAAGSRFEVVQPPAESPPPQEPERRVVGLTARGKKIALGLGLLLLVGLVAHQVAKRKR